MEKQYPIISLNDEFYMIDNDAPFGDNEYYYDTKQLQVRYGSNNHLTGGYKKKVLASTDKSLGLLLLPDIKEDVEQLALEKYPINNQNIGGWLDKDINEDKRLIWIEGYKANTRKYTEEDVEQLFKKEYNRRTEMIPIPTSLWIEKENEYKEWFKTGYKANSLFINSLKSKPIGVIVEGIWIKPWKEDKSGQFFLDVDENNFVKVIKWIYE